MGQANSSEKLQKTVENLHRQLMKYAAGADLDLATSTTLSYEQFLEYIEELNRICFEYKDDNGKILVFAIKKGTNSGIFWKATVCIACLKMDTVTNKVESQRFLNLRQFLQMFRRITYECTGASVGINYSNIDSVNESGSSDNMAAAAACSESNMVPPTVAASMILGSGKKLSGDDGTNLEECIICLERNPDVILPCAHAYCLPCIEQWWEYCKPCLDDCNSLSDILSMSVVRKTCPLCREGLQSEDDAWVISEVPDNNEVEVEIRRSLMGLANEPN